MPANTTGSEDTLISKADAFVTYHAELIEIIERLDTVIQERDTTISDLRGEVADLTQQLAEALRVVEEQSP